MRKLSGTRAYLLCAWTYTNMHSHHPVLAVTEVKVISLDVWADLYDNLHITPTSSLSRKINTKGWRTEGEDVVLLLSHKKKNHKKKQTFVTFFSSGPSRSRALSMFCFFFHLNVSLLICCWMLLMLIRFTHYLSLFDCGVRMADVWLKWRFCFLIWQSQ